MAKHIILTSTALTPADVILVTKASLPQVIQNLAPGEYTVRDTSAAVVGTVTASDVATAPGQFATSDWFVTTGLAAGEIVLNISALPSDGGSPFTAFERTVDGGSTWTALTGTGTGSRTLTMPGAGTAYTFALRAVNAVGAGAASATKSATSGAEAPVVTGITITPFAANRVYQRATTTGGAEGKGQGTMPMLFALDAASPVFARLRDADTGAIVKEAWQVTSGGAAGANSVTLTAIPARKGWHYVDLAKSASGPWELGTSRVAMGRLIGFGGQSQPQNYFTPVNDLSSPQTTPTQVGAHLPQYGAANVAGGSIDTTARAWGVPGDTGDYVSAFACEFLYLQAESSGVTCGAIGTATGGAEIGQFNPANGTSRQLYANISGLGGCEAFLWHLGGSDVPSETADLATAKANYTAALTTVIETVKASSPFAIPNSQIILTAMSTRTTPGISTDNTVTNTAFDRVQAIRIAAREAAEGLGVQYLEPRDIALYGTDGVHQSQLGNYIWAHRYQRVLSGVTDQLRLVSATRDGATIKAQISGGVTPYLVVGSPATRFKVYNAGETKNAYAGSAVAISGTELTLTLSAAPPAAQDLDLYLFGHPDGTGEWAYNNSLYDSRGGGLYRGMEFAPNHTPITIAGAAPTGRVGEDLEQVNGTATFAAGKFGNAMVGGGSNAVRASSYAPTTGAFTLEFWVKYTGSGTGLNFFLNGGNSGDTTNYFRVYSRNSGTNIGNLQFSYRASAATVTQEALALPINDGNWHHVAFVFGTAETRVYLDGALAYTGSAMNTSTVQRAALNLIGGNVGATAYYAGAGTSLDEVATWSGERYSGESFTVPTAQYTGHEENLVSLYHMEDMLAATPV